VNVTVLLSGVLRPSAGGAARLDVEVAEGADLRTVLDQLDARYPALGRRLRDERRLLRRYVNVYLDGEECRRLDSLDTAVTDGAEIQVIPSVAGG
jgi:molybdopterin converting factor small subunit